MCYYRCMQVVFFVTMFVLGAAFGSFLCCQAWRLRLAQTEKGKKKKNDWLGKRSVCLSCHKQLSWYDNVPILSWILLGGKCRYCKKKIGASEIIAELLTGILFLVISVAFVNGGLLNPGALAIESITYLSWCALISLLALALILVFLAIYDGKWGELPTIFLIIAGGLAAIFWVMVGLLYGFSLEYVLQTVGALAILAGLYELLYLVSKGKWVGDGDAVLCIALGIGLGNVWLALFALFLANMLGCLFYVVKNARNKKENTSTMIYFGPFLVIAFFVVLVLRSCLLGLVCF